MKELLGALGFAIMMASMFFYFYAMFMLPRSFEDKRDPRCDGPARYEAMREGQDCS